MSDPLPRVCPGCGTSNAWRTSRLARVSQPQKTGEVLWQMIEVHEPIPVCTVCEAAARRQRRPRTGRIVALASDADPDAGSSNSPAGQLPPI